MAKLHLFRLLLHRVKMLGPFYIVYMLLVIVWSLFSHPTLFIPYVARGKSSGQKSSSDTDASSDSDSADRQQTGKSQV